jgi:phenylpyruvate tautomerase PptA (4-oxalocrotonate tautomerase family)
MPLVRIDVADTTPAETIRAISEVVYEAMTQVARVPVHDKFQIVTRHPVSELIYPQEGYLGIQYTSGIIFLQVTWVENRTIEVKKAFYSAVANGIHTRTGVRREDVFISLIDVAREDWSFGKGEMQYGPK